MNDLYQSSFYFSTEIKEQLLVKNLVSSGMTVFDVGANIGNYSIFLSQLVGPYGKVYSFEPTSSTFRQLLRRFQEFNCSNIYAFQKAIFSENKQIELNEFPEEYSSWNSLGFPKMLDPEDRTAYVPIVHTEIVEAITLDRFCQQNQIETIHYLKIDVEGAESDVLKGALELLKRKAINFIQFEISQKMLEGFSRKAKDTFDVLSEHGYEAHQIQIDGSIGDLATDSQSFYENYVAFPSLETEISKAIDNIYNCVEAYRQERTQIAINNLQQARQQLAELLLNLSADQLAITYFLKLGKVHEIFLNSEIKRENLPTSKLASFDKLIQ